MKVEVDVGQLAALVEPDDDASDHVVVVILAAFKQLEAAVALTHDLDEGQPGLVHRMLGRVIESAQAKAMFLPNMAAGHGSKQIVNDHGIRLGFEAHRWLPLMPRQR